MALARIDTRSPRLEGALLGLLLLVIATGGFGELRAAEPLVGPESPIRFVANGSDPAFGQEWTTLDFDDSLWQTGQFGIGYETGTNGAADLLQTTVPPGTVSIYARATFQLPLTAIQNVHLALDYDDGAVAWINGVEVYRTPHILPGPLAWNTQAIDHESSNDFIPHLVPRLDISDAAVSALQPGENVLAVAVWNTHPGSSDLVLVPRLSINETLELSRQPYLQQATPTTLTVRWRTNLLSSSQVSYGTSPDNLTKTKDSHTPKSDHSIRLTSLEPDTRYFYAVGDSTTQLAGADDHHYFITPPIRGTSKPTRIWALGDSGTADDEARAVRDAYYAESEGRHTDLWLMLGDNAYPDGSDASYQLALFDVFGDMLRRSALWPTLGNHEIPFSNNDQDTGVYYDIFDLPRGPQSGGAASGTESYYSFDHANIHFVVLDSNSSDRSPDGDMMTWLAADLAANDQDWLIAFWHHSPYSRGSHDSDAEIELIEMRENAVPLLEDHGADLILTAHSHSYERSFLLDGHHDGSETLDASMILDGGDGDVYGDGAYAKAELGPEPRTGAVYTVAGSSGRLINGPLDHPVMVRSLLSLGSVILDIDGGRLDAQFLDKHGTVQDQFTIIKGCADPNQRILSRDPTGAVGSNVHTPGLCDAGSPCSSDIASSVSSRLQGAFWRMGAGDPTIGPGIDNGAFPPFANDGEGWVRTDPNVPAFIDSRWSVDPRVDGCLADAAAPNCMATLLTDELNATGYFALATAQEDADGDFSFRQPGNTAIVLAPLPRPRILGGAILTPSLLQLQIGLDPLQGGQHLDAACPSDPIVGYRIYERRTERGGIFPESRRVKNENPEFDWLLTAGGTSEDGQPIPLGQQTSVTLTCFTAVDFALGASLVFESGFETAIVSADSSRILCSNCDSDLDLDGSCGRFLNEVDGPDCDDRAAEVRPDAEQVCGDEQNNDCNHPNWPSLIGTNEFDDDGDGFSECDGDCGDDNTLVWGVPGEIGVLEFAADGGSIIWPAPVDTGGLFVAYDILRSTDRSDFGEQATCVDADQGLPFAVDYEIPATGITFYYLVRSENDCGGTLGYGSNGVERVGRSCP